VRVLHLVHQYPPEFVGGVEHYTQSLAQALAHRGWKTAVFHRTDTADQQLTMRRDGDVTLFAASAGALTPTRRFLTTWRQPRLHVHWQQALTHFQPDLVHVQHLMGLPTSLMHELIERRIPYLITLHDYWWQCANANLLTNYAETACSGPRAYLNCTHCAVARFGAPWAWGAAPVLWPLLAERTHRLRPLLAHAAVLLTPSEFVRRWYAEHGAPTDALRAAPLGVTPPVVSVAPATARDGVQLLYIGGLAPNKGVHVVLEALRSVTGDLRFAIAGDTDAQPAYVAALRQLADARVTFLGRLSRPQVWDALAAADLVVVPSLWHETYCFAAHEALTAGVPVLASTMGALTEAIDDGVNGQLLPPGDVTAWQMTIQRYVAAPARLADLRRRVAPALPFTEHVTAIENTYRTILAAPSP